MKKIKKENRCYLGKLTKCIVNSLLESEHKYSRNEQGTGNKLLECANYISYQTISVDDFIPLWVGAKKNSWSKKFFDYGLFGDEATFHKNGC